MEDRATFHPLDYVSVLRRRKWWLVLPLAACLAIGIALAVLLPKTYESHAEIGVAAPTLSPELLRGVSSLDRDERQRAISQQLLSRGVLERVAREEQINPEQPIELVVGQLRHAVSVSVPAPIGRASHNAPGLDSFQLKYRDSTPERTQRIANRLAYVFVEENSRTRIERVENTSEVLAQQLRASQERLAELEERLRVKKEAHMGRLPNQIEANVQMVNGLRQQLESISNQIRSEQDRLSVIDAQLQAMREGEGGGVLTSTGAATVQGARQRISQLHQELAGVRAMGYTDKHPEVLRLQGEIRTAEQELAGMRQQHAANRTDLLQADPTYRQRQQERTMSQLRIKELQRAEGQARARIAQYESRVEMTPMVEQELVSLNRAYDLERARFADLDNKYQAALVAEDLTRKQGGERFSVIYPAYLPTSPVAPDRLRILAMALGLGLVLGAGAMVGREFLDRSVYDAKALQTEFEVPVLGEIPKIHGAA